MRYIEPKWLIPEEKKQIEVNSVDDNGNKVKIIIPRDERNSDYKSLISQYTIQQIDKNTDESLRIFREMQSRKNQRDVENRARIDGEELFMAKLEAFEMDEVKNTTNKEFKRSIRKSKNKMEVLVNTIVGIINERNKK
tara:strand:- start:4118 stop:4531 length:414 start_codon:yes stop_codon:yes gene_type:complete